MNYQLQIPESRSHLNALQLFWTVYAPSQAKIKVNSWNQIINLYAIIFCSTPLPHYKQSPQTAPWYTPSLRSLKAKGHWYKCLFKKTCSFIRNELCNSHMHYYKVSLSSLKSCYNTELLTFITGNTRSTHLLHSLKTNIHHFNVLLNVKNFRPICNLLFPENTVVSQLYTHLSSNNLNYNYNYICFLPPPQHRHFHLNLKWLLHAANSGFLSFHILLNPCVAFDTLLLWFKWYTSSHSYAMAAIKDPYQHQIYKQLFNFTLSSC